MHLRSASVAAALLTLACGRADVSPRGPSATTLPIVNGTPFGASTRPSAMALVGDFGGFAASFCSSTLVAPDVVMTAAHCVAAIDSDVLPQGGSVFVSGASFISGALPGDAIAASDWVVHPSYSPDFNPTADVGLVFLASASSVLPTAVLRPGETGFMRAGQPVELVGWGLQTPGGQDSGEKMGADIALQVVTPQLLIYGTPIAGQVTVNKCNGDSGGPTFLDVNGVVRVVGIASRSDCQNATLDIRADAFIPFFEDEMSARCANGTRVSCAIDGLPTPGELGAGTLPSPPALVGARTAPASLEQPLLDAAERFASCSGFAVDEGVGFLYVPAFGLGAPACDANDVAAGAAYYDCLAFADCNALFDGSACASEASVVESALSACSDLGGGGGVNPVDELDPPLLEGVDDYCSSVIGCGLTDLSLGDCEQALADQLGDVTSFDCAALEALYGGALTCTSLASCADLANADDPNGCFAAISQADIDAAFADCDAVVGEGEGEGEGEAGEGEGEGDTDAAADDDDTDTDSDDRDRDRGLFGLGILGCASTGPSSGSLVVALLALLGLRRRRPG